MMTEPTAESLRQAQAILDRANIRWSDNVPRSDDLKTWDSLLVHGIAEALPQAGRGKECVWGVAAFKISGDAEAFGASRLSDRLHWSQADARIEAQKFARELGAGSIEWDQLDDDHFAIGRFAGHAVIIRGIQLPIGEPPPPPGRPPR